MTWMMIGTKMVLVDEKTGTTLGGITPTHEHDLLGMAGVYDVYSHSKGFLGVFMGLDRAQAALLA